MNSMAENGIERTSPVGISSVDIISGASSLLDDTATQRGIRINRHDVVDNLRVSRVDNLKSKNTSGACRNKSVVGHIISRRILKPDAAVRHASNRIIDDSYVLCASTDINSYCHVAGCIRYQLTPDDGD